MNIWNKSILNLEESLNVSSIIFESSFLEISTDNEPQLLSCCFQLSETVVNTSACIWINHWKSGTTCNNQVPWATCKAVFRKATWSMARNLWMCPAAFSNSSLSMAVFTPSLQSFKSCRSWTRCWHSETRDCWVNCYYSAEENYNKYLYSWNVKLAHFCTDAFG